jgi:copper chaperone
VDHSDTPLPYLSRITMKTHTDTHRTYTVTGMTCSHCVSSVREEVSEVEGVTDVDVDLASGRLTVSGSDVSDKAIAAAVADAGYSVAS